MINVDAGDFTFQFVCWQSLLSTFQRELLQDTTTLQLTRLDVMDKNNWIRPQDTDSGMGAESILKIVW